MRERGALHENKRKQTHSYSVCVCMCFSLSPSPSLFPLSPTPLSPCPWVESSIFPFPWSSSFYRSFIHTELPSPSFLHLQLAEGRMRHFRSPSHEPITIINLLNPCLCIILVQFPWRTLLSVYIQASLHVRTYIYMCVSIWKQMLSSGLGEQKVVGTPWKEPSNPEP